jgi:hypothetical protein
MESADLDEDDEAIPRAVLEVDPVGRCALLALS